MVVCVIKVCRNYKGRSKTTTKASYHRMPLDPILRKKWIDIIRRSRGDDFWTPKKHSVICSEHFCKADIYYVKEQGPRRVKKGAVPRKALFLSSLQSDGSDVSDREPVPSVCEDNKNTTEEATTLIPNVARSFKRLIDTEVIRSSFFVTAAEPTGHCKDVQRTYTGTESFVNIVPGPTGILRDTQHISPDDIKNTSKSAFTTENDTLIHKDFSDLDSVFDSPRKLKLKRELRRKNILLKKNRLKIQSLRRKNILLKKKIVSFKEIIEILKKQRYIDTDTHQILSNSVFAADLHNLLIKKFKKGLKRPVSKYSSDFRKFCLTLHFMSPKAYSYVRTKFETCLPHPKTISKWYGNIDGSPGLTEEAFNVLKAKRNLCGKNMVCALIADEMAIRQQKCFNTRSGEDEGLIDMGTGVNDDLNIKASEAYIFLLVSLNEPWKLPLAYFLIHGMTGEQKGNIIKTIIIKCHQSGVDIVSMTFDGHRSNLFAMESLGCSYRDPRRLKTTFQHPCADYKVAVFLDFCHMVKLIRNHFESKGCFLYKDAEINWEYIKKIVELQEETGVHLANRLTNKHIAFRNSIMNVKLATQLLIRSVSKALEFCRLELRLPDFTKSEATEQFILIMKYIFDVFNSRNLNSHSFKHPLYPGNKNEVFSLLQDVEDLILNLNIKFSRKRTYTENQLSKKLIIKTYKPVLESQSFTGFVGVLICIKSLKILYETLIESNKMNFLCTYRISQDHLELFFGAIRMHGGYNDNPNARQLKGIFRKLLCHMELKSVKSGNCVPLENISVLTCSSSLHSINATTPSSRINDADESENEEHINMENLEESGSSISRYLDNSQAFEYIQQIVGYIAGYVVRCLRRRIKCIACIESLTTNNKLEYHKLVNLRDDGGLIYASRDVYDICKTAETVLRTFLKQNFIMTNAINSKILSIILKRFIGKNCFEVKSEHACGRLHQVLLLRLVAEKYVTIRCFHVAKLDKQKNAATSKRNLFRKQIQREGH